MKITKSKLKQIIKEELTDMLSENTNKSISIWYAGAWHDTILTGEEEAAIHDARFEDEAYSEAVERILSSLRNIDIEDVEL